MMDLFPNRPVSRHQPFIMNRLFFALLFSLVSISLVNAQDLSEGAQTFIRLLTDSQKVKALFPFDTEERYRFNYVPLDDRKGISFNELNTAQRAALMNLLHACIGDETVEKVKNIMQLDVILKKLENRPPGDHFRDPGKYFVSIFGIPSANAIWGWRFEGHHVALHFSSENNQLVAGTPGFLGSNPAVVLDGPQKGEEVLKDETARGFALIQALSPGELKEALIDSVAPAEIITGSNRKAMIGHPAGIRYSELSAAHQQLLLQLLSLYVHRYTKLFAETMLKEIQSAGLENLWFTWAGTTTKIAGKPYYYRIQGPTIIIEYDNTQNNANHVHTVVRDLNSDFGGDLLLEHYRRNH